jgi:MFS transporter, FSR family, fosmidomycin resistance protein
MQAVMFAVYPLLRDSYALTFTQVGLIHTCFHILAAVLQPVIGHLTDKRPTPWLMPMAPVCTCIGLMLLATASSYPLILTAALAIGLGSAIFHPDASRVARLSSGGRYGFAQSVFQVGGNVGTALGPLLAAAIVFPRGQGSIAWFAFVATAAVVVLSFVARWYQGHLTATAAKPKPAPAKKQAPRTVTLAITILLALMFSKFVYTAGMHSFYSFYLIHEFGVTASQAQIYMFVFLGAIAAGTFAGGPIGDRVGARNVIWMSILGALPFALALPYMNLWGTVLLTIPVGFILSSAFPAMVVYAQELLPGRVGMISGLMFGFAFGMAGLGAAGLGMLADATSIGIAFKATSFLPLLGLLALALPELRRT